MPAKNDKKTAAKAPSAAKASPAAQAASAAKASTAGAATPRRARELSRPQLETLRQKLSRQYHGSR